jgi:hypothetical protein
MLEAATLAWLNPIISQCMIEKMLKKFKSFYLKTIQNQAFPILNITTEGPLVVSSIAEKFPSKPRFSSGIYLP